MSFSYVISDIHGHYAEYQKMLSLIDFKQDDMLYVLGDNIDRGPEPMKVLLDLMNRPNVVCLAGNHCVMACECLRFLMNEITEESLKDFDEDKFEMLLAWQENGGSSTLTDFRALKKEQQVAVLNFIGEFDVYEEVFVGGQDFVLVHAGLGNFDEKREIWDYELDELVWYRPDFDKAYFKDKILVVGHTPTLLMESKIQHRPGYIFKGKNLINIDCGCGIPGGRLGCLRLDDMKEFYVEMQ